MLKKVFVFLNTDTSTYLSVRSGTLFFLDYPFFYLYPDPCVTSVVESAPTPSQERSLPSPHNNVNAKEHYKHAEKWRVDHADWIDFVDAASTAHLQMSVEMWKFVYTVLHKFTTY